MPAPTVTAISPAIGGEAGGITATLTGTNFTGTTGVTIGGVAATNVTVVSPTSITLTLPAGTKGVASVVVTNGSGSNGANSLFVYIPNEPADIYVYLRGGRGDGFVPEWTGEVSEEGMVDSSGVAVDENGKEVSEPYRDIFAPTGSTAALLNVNGSAYAVTRTDLRLSNPSLVAPATGPIQGYLSGTLAATDSDEISHTKPRQYFKVFTWLAFVSSNGQTYKYRKADVIGWGSQART